MAGWEAAPGFRLSLPGVAENSSLVTLSTVFLLSGVPPSSLERSCDRAVPGASCPQRDSPCPLLPSLKLPGSGVRKVQMRVEGTGGPTRPRAGFREPDAGGGGVLEAEPGVGKGVGNTGTLMLR